MVAAARDADTCTCGRVLARAGACGMRARNGSVTRTEGPAEHWPAAPHVPACLPTLPTPHRAHTPTRLPAPGRQPSHHTCHQPDRRCGREALERVVPVVRPSAILLRPRLHDARANEAHAAGYLRGSARTVRELELAHAWRGSGCGLGAWVHVQVGAGSSASSGASSAAAFTTMPEQTSHPTVPPHCAARVPASTDLFDELATPVKSAAPMHTIDIVRMPAGRPAHPRSTP